MSELVIAETKWVENTLIPHVLKNIGKSSNSVRSEISFPEHDFYINCVYFVTLTFQSVEEKSDEPNANTLKLVIKKPRMSRGIHPQESLDSQCHNEILFYTKFARGSSRFPRCVYTHEEAPGKSVIVTENITPMGYKICADAYDVPLEYVLAAVEEIGRFHAMGYVMKECEPEAFNEIINDIEETRFQPEGSWMTEFLNIVATRPIDWLRKNNCDPTFCDRLERHLGNAYEEVMVESMKPVEPLATLCHGDFTRNNVFFRKTSGKMEAMLFDFAVMSYGSPSIDMSTFLYLNCSTRDRVEKFDDIFGAYHGALITYLRDAGIENLEKYSYDKMLADYRRRATFGFLIAIYYLPVIREQFTLDIENYVDNFALTAPIVKGAGGEATTEEFGKMILELKNTGCLDHLC